MENFNQSKAYHYFSPLSVPFGTSLSYITSNKNSNTIPPVLEAAPIHNGSYNQIQGFSQTASLNKNLSNTATLKRNYDSRSSSASPDSNQSTPKKGYINRLENHSPPNYSTQIWNSSPATDLSSNMININILNATYFKCKKDLIVIQNKRVKVQKNLSYLVENILPKYRTKIPYLKVKQEHILEVMTTANFFYKSVCEEVERNYQQLLKITGLRNSDISQDNAVSINIGNLLLNSKQILQNVQLLQELDSNMVAAIAHTFGKILSANLDSKYYALIVQMQCWILDLLVNLLPGYVHRIMKVSAAREARGISIKECRSRKRCLTDWLAVVKSLNIGKIDVYTTINRFTAVAGVSAILQYSEKRNPIKEIISTTFNDDVVQKTYDICQSLEEVIEPLRQMQKILAYCFVNDESLSSLMVDQVHNPLFEKRLYMFRTGPTSVFPKKLISELEKLFHQEFIQGPTFFATQQYERRCITCQNSLGQECILCTGCNLVRYCGDHCAKADKSNHAQICSSDRFEILRIFLDKVSEDRNCREIEVV